LNLRLQALIETLQEVFHFAFLQYSVPFNILFSIKSVGLNCNNATLNTADNII